MKNALLTMLSLIGYGPTSVLGQESLPVNVILNGGFEGRELLKLKRTAFWQGADRKSIVQESGGHFLRLCAPNGTARVWQRVSAYDLLAELTVVKAEVRLPESQAAKDGTVRIVIEDGAGKRIVYHFACERSAEVENLRVKCRGILEVGDVANPGEQLALRLAELRFHHVRGPQIGFVFFANQDEGRTREPG